MDNDHGVCPHCGYCKCCGRGPSVMPYRPVYPFPYTPTITWGSGTILDNTTDKVFVNIKQED